MFDHRELRSGIPDALVEAGIELRPEQLPAGDYVISDRLVVKRKTGADLAASIKDRRLFEQIAEDVLRCLPGISTVGARRLLGHFGSLRAVFAADEDELRAVPGIGPVRGAALGRLFGESVARASSWDDADHS